MRSQCSSLRLLPTSLCSLCEQGNPVRDSLSVENGVLYEISHAVRYANNWGRVAYLRHARFSPATFPSTERHIPNGMRVCLLRRRWLQMRSQCSSLRLLPTSLCALRAPMLSGLFALLLCPAPVAENLPRWRGIKGVENCSVLSVILILQNI